MTVSAWVMLVVTWSVIVVFASRFLLAVIRTPPRDGAEGDAPVDSGPSA